MNILHLHPGPDTGGQSMAGKRVLEAAGHNVRVFVHGFHPFGYPAAEKWDAAAIADAYDVADVVIIHNDARLFERVDNGMRKNLIVHHHGTRFRSNPGPVYEAAAAIGARQIVSTVDLLGSVPEGGRATWFPQVVDVDRMRMMRDLHRPGPGRPVVTHAPTNRQVKGTRYVVRAMRRLKGEIDVKIISHQSWTMCLTHKAMSDLFVDQLWLGYGNNAIEAWAMGIPVIAGASDDVIEAMAREFGTIPFLRTSPNMLVPDIRTMLRDRELYDAYVAAGQAHVTRYHDPKAWLRRTLKLYRAIDEPSSVGVHSVRNRIPDGTREPLSPVAVAI